AGFSWGWILMKVVAPFVFSVPFFLWSYLWRDQIADTYELMGQRVLKLSVGTLLFYGINFGIVLLLLLPVIAPLVALGGGFFIARLIFGETRSKKVLLITLLYIPIPLFIAIGFYLGIYNEFIQLVTYWNEILPFLYGICIAIADGIAIGSLILLIFEGAKQVDSTVSIPNGLITLSSLGLAVIFAGIFLIGSEGMQIITFDLSFWIHIVAIGIGIIVLVIRYLKGLSQVSEAGYLGWASIIAFQLVNIASSQNLALITRPVAVFLGFGLFLLLFAISFWEVTQNPRSYGY
ncbi:MAG: hypothetical protein ACFFBD_17410, partial [Candidatus Hodarchaeota archaeon]